jgi:hypothetical protein
MLGGLKGEVAYDDRVFDLDPDIQWMFYGPEGGAPDGAGPDDTAS